MFVLFIIQRSSGPEWLTKLRSGWISSRSPWLHCGMFLSDLRLILSWRVRKGFCCSWWIWYAINFSRDNGPLILGDISYRNCLFMFLVCTIPSPRGLFLVIHPHFLSWKVHTYEDLESIAVSPFLVPPSASVVNIPSTLLQWLIDTALGTSTAIDFVIAAAMCYYLRKSKGSISR